MTGQAQAIDYDDRYRNVAEARIIDMLLLAGWAYDRDSGRIATQQALEAWIDMGLGVRRKADGARWLDPVEVVNVLKQAGLDGRDGFWADRYVRTGRQLVTDLASQRDQGGPFCVDFRRTYALRTVAPGMRMRLRLRLPLPLNADLAVQGYVEGSEDVQLDMSPGRLQARMPAASEGDVILGAKLTFAAESTDEILGDEALYLRPREGLIAVTPRISELSWSLAGQGATPQAAVRAFWGYMMDVLKSGAIHYDQVDAEAPCDWVLDTGWYDCQLGSALFAALCRARGIAARIVGGHVLYRRAPTNHYWVEVWLDGRWQAFDFLCWDLSAGGRDGEWRDHFFGRVDARMVTQRMPLHFTGALGVALPQAWSIVQCARGDGIEISLSAIDGTPVYSDTIVVG